MKRNLDEIISRAKDARHHRDPHRHGSAAELRAAYTSEFRQVFRDLADEHDVAFVPFYLDGVAGIPIAEQLPTASIPTPTGARIIEQTRSGARSSRCSRRIDDRAARRLQDGRERRPSADDSASARPLDSLGPLRGDRRAVGQRQVDAARAARRPRRAEHGRDPDRRHRHHEARARTSWRGCAARRSASSSSSFTSCRR